MIRIAPSLLSADFTDLRKELETISEADLLHIDVMDGVFVPNIAIGLPAVEALNRIAKKPMDVHLMITRPQDYIKRFAEAGADILSFHTESNCNIGQCIEAIKNCGKKPALAINPSTEIETVLPFLKDLYMVLVMTVQPGFGGQPCKEECFEKVIQLRRIIEQQNLSVHIEVDGGITAENASRAIAAGADILVAGSSVFKAADRNAAIAKLKGN